MGFINYDKRPRVAIVANGHPYDRSAFMEMFDSIPDMECFLIEHPVAPMVLTPGLADHVDAVVLYDMPGGNPWDGPDYPVDPPEQFKKNFIELLDRGMPIVALHHAICSWPTWDEYGEILGGKLIHFPGTVRGAEAMDGGYRQDVTYNLSAVDAAHPIFDGVPQSFEIEDEVYLFEVFLDSITPLVISDFDFSSKSLYSLARAMAGNKRSNEGWVRPSGSNVIGWTKWAGNSALFYLQAGHGPTAYENPHYRRMLHNAINWTIGETRNRQAERQECATVKVKRT